MEVLQTSALPLGYVAVANLEFEYSKLRNGLKSSQVRLPHTGIG